MNKNIFTLTLILMFLLMNIIGCSEPDKEGVANYFPSTVESSWEFKGTGNEFAEYKQTVTYQKDDKVQFAINNSGTSSKAIYTISDNAITRVLLIHESYDDENLLETDYEPNDDTIMIKLPFQVGNKWDVPNGSREIVDTESNIITPAEYFTDCIKIKCEFNESEGYSYEYYQKDVGLVKTEYIHDDYKINSTLKKYFIS
ncbi:MAG TPA: hypothetical protein VFC73_09350 [Syntrophomonadaceae bacterium]|nr:hypothetical protein [Syntrophomonadaceae bacterium]